MNQLHLTPASIEGSFTHTRHMHDFRHCNLFFLPGFHDAVKVNRSLLHRSAQMNSPCTCGSNALRLPLADVVSLVLCYKGQHLQYNVAQKCAHKVLTAPGIQQRHIDPTDIYALLFGQNPPLNLEFLIVTPKPVNALDIEQITGFQFAQQLLILRANKVLAGLFINVNMLVFNANLMQGDQLSILVLIRAGYTGISVPSRRGWSEWIHGRCSCVQLLSQ